MKVVEKNSDRRAEVNIYAAGFAKPLDEYGEYIDPTDNAVCCFVPVAEGDKIRVSGKFHGTTDRIHSDIYIDGVYRKAVTFNGKTVTFQKSRDLGSHTYLFKLPDDTLVDSEVMVERVNINAEEKSSLSIGTIEIRVWVLRRAGDETKFSPPRTFDTCEGTGRTTLPVGYKTIRPELAMSFDENNSPLLSHLVSRQRKLLSASRPGTEPWAIFRFHYRSQDQIEEAGMKRTFAHSMKKKPPPVTLKIQELPPLDVKPKVGQPGGNGGTPSRQSSVAPSVTGSLAETTLNASPSPTTNTTASLTSMAKSSSHTSGHDACEQSTCDNADAMTDIEAYADVDTTGTVPKPTPLTITTSLIPYVEAKKHVGRLSPAKAQIPADSDTTTTTLGNKLFKKDEVKKPETATNKVDDNTISDTSAARTFKIATNGLGDKGERNEEDKPSVNNEKGPAPTETLRHTTTGPIGLVAGSKKESVAVTALEAAPLANTVANMVAKQAGNLVRDNATAGLSHKHPAPASGASDAIVEPLPRQEGPPTPTTPVKRSFEISGMDPPLSPSLKRAKASAPGSPSVQSPGSEHASFFEKVQEFNELKKKREELAVKRKELEARKTRWAKRRAEIERRTAHMRAEYERELREFEEAQLEAQESEEAVRAMESMDFLYEEE
ncbi:uncharacterized protein EI97DRAFT_18651 [Westerdykella ornata]|uniref:Uncharacterized protein n=1 Tax=Westerdykella ornata TaxID=318751 RepID=A0A6A6JZ39_WESOR|nr:uncharacterized protein EI97DRAFT_18651 [Westerdykella ornata]KAF2281026.1 hypothetical protein EI97DRAFT_18651 [Westerdykella ornata]